MSSKLVTLNGNLILANGSALSVDVGSGGNLQESKTVNPSTSQQTVLPDSGYDGLEQVIVTAMPSGTATGPSSLSASNAIVDVGTNTLTFTKNNVTTTPTVSAGYISSATASTATVALTASVTTKSATTYTPTTSNQTISSGTYLTGTQTISGDANLVAGNIKKDVSIFGVTGSYEGSGGSTTINPLYVTPTGSTQVFDGTSTIYTIPTGGIDNTNWEDTGPSLYELSNFNLVEGNIYKINGVITINNIAFTLDDANWEFDLSSTSTYGNFGYEITSTPTTARFWVNLKNNKYYLLVLGNGADVNRKSGYVNTAITFKESSVDGYLPVTVYAISTMTLPSSVSAMSQGTRQAEISQTSDIGYLNIPVGYNDTAKYYTIPALTSMTLPTSASSTSSGTSKATISRSTADQYINIPTGYNTTAAYYKINAVADGSATGPSSLSASSATVTTGVNTITLTKTGVTTTPTVSAGYVSSATASTATVALTASVTTKAAATFNTSITDQTIASGTYITGTQTIKAVTISGLSADKILSGTTVMVGDANDADRIASVSGSVTFATYYTGSSAPSAALGVNGDIYLQTAS